MAERSSRRRTTTTSKDSVETKDKELAEVDREQLSVSALDDPSQPDQASPSRGWLYFAAIVVFATALNLAVLMAVSGGR